MLETLRDAINVHKPKVTASFGPAALKLDYLFIYLFGKAGETRLTAASAIVLAF